MQVFTDVYPQHIGSGCFGYLLYQVVDALVVKPHAINKTSVANQSE